MCLFTDNAGASAKLYSAPGYLPPQPERPTTVPCQGNGRACVPQYQCQGGYVDASQLSGLNSRVIFILQIDRKMLVKMLSIIMI